MNPPVDPVIITYPTKLNSGGSPGDVASHELMHAQYMLDPRYQRAADEFYNTKIDRADYAKIKAALSGMYNTDDDYLTKNEFQAYMLMRGADKNRRFSALAAKYRSEFMAYMEQSGLHPIQVQWSDPKGVKSIDDGSVDRI